MKTALFVARLQPLHKGHLYALRMALKKYDKLVVLIGSTNRHDKSNPFSFALRKKMLRAALKGYKKRYKIIGVPDFSSDARWSLAVKRKAKFDAVVSGSPWVKRCLSNFDVEKPKMLNRKRYNATYIRRLMKKGSGWQKLVPKEVVKIIEL